MKTIRFILALKFLLFLNNVFALDKPISGAESLRNINCSDFNLPFEYIPCMEKKLKSLDESLNRNYKTLTGKMNNKNKITLRDSQRAWITFRDLSCRLVSELEEVKNPQNGMQVSQSAIANINCLVDFTEKRTEELSNLIENY